MSAPRGLIHKIERFSLHDGPGIRTLVVMKGCPLNCLWCSSPQTQKSRPELLYIRNRCRLCGACRESCPTQAIGTVDEDPSSVKTDRLICRGCGACTAVCPNSARLITGCSYAPEALLDEVKKDAGFYRRSEGGVTVGGGEAAVQSEFVAAFLSLCRMQGLHTALETSTSVSWNALAPLIEHLDLVYVDLKHMDETRHQALTGMPNRPILENIGRIARLCPVILRIPVVPGLNDDRENLLRTAQFAGTLGANLLRLELLPYHRLGRHLYDELERDYPLEDIVPPTDEKMEELRNLMEGAGMTVQIGG